MSSEILIQADARAVTNKSTIAKLRLTGVVPAVVYGRSGTKAIQIAVKSLPKGHTGTQVVSLDVGGNKTKVLMREVQVNPLTDAPIHIDFQEVSATDVVRARVPLKFEGLTREQEKEGSFKILLRSIEVKGAVGKLPTSVTVNVGSLKVDESAHVSDTIIPEGVKVVAQRNLALASLVKL